MIAHSCGGIYPFIGDIIECGLDVLDPIQTSVKGMELARLKKEFGGSLCFHGGVDTQRVMPLGKPEAVEEEVKNCLHHLGAGGGYILATAHNIQADVPPENIVAMFQAAQRWGQYPLQIL